MKKTMFLLSVLIALSLILIGCETAPSNNNKPTSVTQPQIEDTTLDLSFLEQDNLQYIEIESMNTHEWILKLSKISSKYNLSEIIDIFDENNKVTDGKIPVFTDGEILFYPGDVITKTSAHLICKWDTEVEPAVQLALYDFDQDKLKEKTENNAEKRNAEFEEKVAVKNTSGRITAGNYESIGEFINKLAAVNEKITYNKLEFMFGKLPKDISDTKQKKYAYYMWQGSTIVFYDVPFSYCEIFVPGGSVKVMFEDSARMVE